jgi:hypothetical protein
LALPIGRRSSTTSCTGITLERVLPVSSITAIVSLRSGCARSLMTPATVACRQSFRRVTHAGGATDSFGARGVSTSTATRRAESVLPAETSTHLGDASANDHKGHATRTSPSLPTTVESGLHGGVRYSKLPRTGPPVARRRCPRPSLTGPEMRPPDAGAHGRRSPDRRRGRPPAPLSIELCANAAHAESQARPPPRILERGADREPRTANRTGMAATVRASQARRRKSPTPSRLRSCSGARKGNRGQDVRRRR